MAHTRYNQRFSDLKSQQKNMYMPFTLLGWPDIITSAQIMDAMVEGGAGALELGIAFRDPVADGPIIQQAALECVDSGFTVADAFSLLRNFRKKHTDIPIGLLVYFNLVLAQGVDSFFRQAAESGVDGVLIADLPPELADEVHTAAENNNIALVFIISPLTTAARLQLIAKYASGFLYAVSRLGTTGTFEKYDDDLKALIDRAHDICPDLPVCVGFGVSTPENVRQFLQLGAEGTITGSRIIELARSGGAKAVRDYVREMSQVSASEVTSG